MKAVGVSGVPESKRNKMPVFFIVPPFDRPLSDRVATQGRCRNAEVVCRVSLPQRAKVCAVIAELSGEGRGWESVVFLLLWISTVLGERILPRINCFYFIPEAAAESRFRFLFVDRRR